MFLVYEMYQAFSELHSPQAVDLMQDIIDVYICRTCIRFVIEKISSCISYI